MRGWLEFLKDRFHYTKFCGKILIENNRLRAQLTKANEVAIFYANLQKKIINEGPFEMGNFNKAAIYCYDHSLPTNVDSLKDPAV
jgi:hypothetical protein